MVSLCHVQAAEEAGRDLYERQDVQQACKWVPVRDDMPLNDSRADCATLLVWEVSWDKVTTRRLLRAASERPCYKLWVRASAWKSK